jgi:hypothetical protein
MKEAVISIHIQRCDERTSGFGTEKGARKGSRYGVVLMGPTGLMGCHRSCDRAYSRKVLSG